MNSSDDEWMLIGRIAGVFGLRGELKVEPMTDHPERFSELDEVYVGPELRPRHIEGARRHKSMVLLRLDNVETPETAAQLAGQEIRIPRSAAAPLPEGHYYLDDLLGLAVSTASGQEVGAISEVVRTGSNDVYVVGRGKNAVLIPGIKDAVRSLDLAARRMVVEDWVLTSGE